jgi:hypothetical protein
MEIRDRQTGDAVAEIASLLATAYQRSRRARCIEIATHEAADAVNGKLANPHAESLHIHEVDA